MRILIVHDDTPTADAAARFVLGFAPGLRARVTVVGVARSPGAEPRAAGEAERVGELARGLDLPTEVVTVEGRTDASVAAAVLELVADRGDGGLIALGGRRRNGLPPLTGSTTRALLRRSPVPVLVVGDAPAALRRVLVCTSLQLPHGAGALDPAVRIAGATGAEVDVLHVMSQLPPDGRSTDVVGNGHGAEWHREHGTPEGRHLDEVLAVFAAGGVDARAAVRHGLVVDEIVAHARQQPADLVVVGAHERAGRRSWLLENITLKVSDELARPVLVLQPPRAPDQVAPPRGGR